MPAAHLSCYLQTVEVQALRGHMYFLFLRDFGLHHKDLKKQTKVHGGW